MRVAVGMRSRVRCYLLDRFLLASQVLRVHRGKGARQRRQRGCSSGCAATSPGALHCCPDGSSPHVTCCPPFAFAEPDVGSRLTNTLPPHGCNQSPQQLARLPSNLQHLHSPHHAIALLRPLLLPRSHQLPAVHLQPQHNRSRRVINTWNTRGRRGAWRCRARELSSLSPGSGQPLDHAPPRATIAQDNCSKNIECPCSRVHTPATAYSPATAYTPATAYLSASTHDADGTSDSAAAAVRTACLRQTKTLKSASSAPTWPHQSYRSGI